MGVRWGNITIARILKPIRGKLVSGSPETLLEGITTDSRTTAKGELFFALKGERYDGHDYVRAALSKGAAAILVERRFWEKIGQHIEDKALGANQNAPFAVVVVEDSLTALGDLAAWWRKQHQVQVAAITGSTGKTTTKEMAAHILGLGAETLKNQGNFNNLIGVPLTLFRLDQKVQRVVVEMGMNRPGEIGRLTRMADPDVGAITNVGMAHVEGVGGLEGVIRAKVELVENLSPKGTVILNGDDEKLLRAASVFSRETVTVGLGEKNDMQASRIQNLGRKGVKFDLHYKGQTWPVKLQVPGIHNIQNATTAAAIGFCLDAPAEHIVQGLARFRGVKGRCNLIKLADDMAVLDDTYNSNPLSLKAALLSGADLMPRGGKMIACLGEMRELGDASKQAHFEAGKQTAQVAHFLFALGEHAKEMVNGALSEGMSPEKAVVINDHAKMVSHVNDVAEPGDLILIKGSRMVQMEKVVEGVKKCMGVVES
jgi:UDP-N-acetylmuramoyl-tripeptide--D-alanyl-D-alanine ligase